MKLLTGLLALFAATATVVAQQATNPPPIIIDGLISQIVTQGNVVKFIISAQLPTGFSGPLRYRWSSHTHTGAITNITSTATNSTLTISNVQFVNQGQYLVYVSYPGSVSTSKVATLTVPTTNILNGCTISNFVGVKWDYDLTSDPAVYQFRLHYGIDSNSLTSTQYVAAPELSTTISNLLAHNFYFIQATAVNTNGGESPPSNEITYGFDPQCGGISFPIDILILTNNIPRLTAKVCPNCSVTIYRTVNFRTWSTVGATVADQYGNVIFDDHNAPANYGFYRMSSQ